MARAPVQGGTCPSTWPLYLILCFLMSLDALSVRDDLTLAGGTGWRLLTCQLPFVSLQTSALCPSPGFHHSLSVIPCCWSLRAPAALGLYAVAAKIRCSQWHHSLLITLHCSSVSLSHPSSLHLQPPTACVHPAGSRLKAVCMINSPPQSRTSLLQCLAWRHSRNAG